MKDFLFVFRNDPAVMLKRSPEEMQAITKKWMDWIGGIAAQNKLSDRGNRLESTGKVLRGNKVVTDGPYTELKETLGGYSLVKANSLQEAAKLAEGCPVFEVGGSVEVREISPM
jgi:hypothetical protein